MSRRTTIAEKYWSKTERRADDECWPWLGSKDRRGYGMVKSGNTTRRAHVVAWEIANARAFPSGLRSSGDGRRAICRVCNRERSARGYHARKSHNQRTMTANAAFFDALEGDADPARFGVIGTC